MLDLLNRLADALEGAEYSDYMRSENSGAPVPSDLLTEARRAIAETRVIELDGRAQGSTVELRTSIGTPIFLPLPSPMTPGPVDITIIVRAGGGL